MKRKLKHVWNSIFSLLQWWGGGRGGFENEFGDFRDECGIFNFREGPISMDHAIQG
ncbi:hypothetical protein AAHE18_20G229000 [Arachis hypogaea]